jgi:TDG/mug DNA glycosylase family protein
MYLIASPCAVLEEKLGEARLELLLVGHNPSAAAWQSGHYYSGPNNNFEKLVVESGLCMPCEQGMIDDWMLAKYNIGFTDVSRLPNSDSSALNTQHMRLQSTDFYKRIIIHAKRVNGYPKRIGFVGKRQYKLLFNPPLKSVDLGPQTQIPDSFPNDVEIWVLSSTSGRAVMSWSERIAPWVELANSMHNAFKARNIE